MGEDVDRGALQVLRQDVIAVLEHGDRHRHAQPHERRARARRREAGRVAPHRRHDVDGVALHALGHVDGREEALPGEELVGAEHGREPADGDVLADVDVEHPHLGVGRREAHRDADGEAIELRGGEREGAVVLEGVHRGEDQERLRQHVRRAVDRDLPLGHDLEEGRLGLRRRAVDLVGEEDVGEDRARARTRTPSCGG